MEIKIISKPGMNTQRAGLGGMFALMGYSLRLRETAGKSFTLSFIKK